MRIYIAAAFSLWLTCLKGQSQDQLQIKPGSRLLYYLDAGQSNAYMVPYVESVLKGLKSGKDNSQMLLSEVISLNIALSNKKIQSEILGAFDYYDRGKSELYENAKATEVDEIIANKLNNNDLFLRININTLNSLIEYQFVLFSVVEDTAKNKGSSGRKSFLKPNLTKYRSSSVFIDPTGNDYKDKLLFCIRQVFSEANERPVPIITSNKSLINGCYYVAVNDTISFEPSEIDRDSPKEKISYEWKKGGRLSSKIFNFNPQTKVQTFSFKDTGTVHLTLTVSDGIDKSDDTTITVNVIHPMELVTAYSRFGVAYNRQFRYIINRHHYGDIYNHYMFIRTRNAINPEYNFYINKFGNKPADRQFMEQVILDSAICCLGEKHICGKIDTLKRPGQFNIVKCEDLNNRYILIPPDSDKQSTRYWLTVKITDAGNQAVEKDLDVHFQRYSDLILYYSLSLYYARIDGKFQSVNNNLLGFEWIFSEPISADFSMGFLNFKNTEKDREVFALGELTQRFGMRYYPSFIRSRRFEYSIAAFLFRFTWRDANGKLIHPVSFGFGPGVKTNIIDNIGISVFAHYYPRLGKTNFENLSLYNSYEIGFIVSYMHFRKKNN